MANTFLEFLQEMEEEQKQQMHREWVNNKKKERFKKELNEVIDNIKKDFKENWNNENK